MDWKFATEMCESPFRRFWVVLLDNGVEIYQNEPDPSLEIGNPWLRLNAFCKDKSVNIVNMAWVDLDDPSKQINLRPNADGYFYSKQIRVLMNAGPLSFHEEIEGIGNLLGNTLIIYWRHKDDTIEVEHRDMGDINLKHSSQLGLIKNSNAV